jgi:hypothetical protein
MPGVQPQLVVDNSVCTAKPLTWPLHSLSACNQLPSILTEAERMSMTLHVFVLFVCFCMLTVACLCSLYWSHHNSSPSKGRLRSLVLRRLKPRSPLACPLCCRTSGGSSGQELSSRAVRPWRESKSRRGARHPRADRGLCLPKQCVPVLWDHQYADPCFGGRWQPWAS